MSAGPPAEGMGSSMQVGRTLEREESSGGEDVPPAAGAHLLYPPRTRLGLDPTKRSEFLDRLAALRRASLALATPGLSSLQILDLEQIRLRFSRRWPQVRAKALAIVEASLQRQLGPEDAYVAASDTVYYLFRLGLPRRDADRRGRLLAADITERLCGTVPGGVAVQIKTAPYSFHQGFAGVASYEQLRNRIEAVSRALDDLELRLFLDNAAWLEPWFRPTIHLRKGLVSAYHMVPMLVRPAVAAQPLASLCPVSFNGVFDAEADNWAIQQAAHFLTAAGAGRCATIIVPIHYETLAAMRFREPFLALCRHLPPRSSRHLLLEVLGLQPGLPQARVRELMTYVQPFSIAMLARLPHDAIYAGHLLSSGILGLSLDAEELDPDAPGTPETLHMLVEEAGSHRMRSLLVGAGSVRLCHQALKAGIDQLNGDAFMPAAPRPGRAILTQRVQSGLEAT